MEGICKSCNRPFLCEEGSDEEGTGTCYECFEAGLEEYEQRKRERIQRQNEY